MKLVSPTFLALLAAVPVIAAPIANTLANTLTIIIVTEWTDGVIDKIPIQTLPPDVRFVNGLSLQWVGDLQFDQVGQTYEFKTSQTGWGGHEYYQVSETRPDFGSPDQRALTGSVKLRLKQIRGSLDFI